MVGPGVTTLKEEDRVAIPWLGYACGECEYCMSGWIWYVYDDGLDAVAGPVLDCRHCCCGLADHTMAQPQANISVPVWTTVAATASL